MVNRKKVLLLCPNALGHLKPFVVIARKNIELGYQVTVVVSEDSVLVQFPDTVSVVVVETEFWFSNVFCKTFKSKWALTLTACIYNPVKECQKRFDRFEARVRLHDYDVIFIDRFLSYIALVYPELRRKFIIVNTMMNCYRGEYNPPLNAFLHPDMRLFRVRCIIAWIRHYVDHLINYVWFGQSHPYKIYQYILLHRDIPNCKLGVINEFGSSIFPGIQDLREVCVTFECLDFPRYKMVKHVTYLGVLVGNNTKSFDIPDEILGELIQRAKKESKTIVYLSFGTIRGGNMRYSVEVINMLLHVVESRSDLFAIMTGAQDWFDVVDIKSSNVYITNFVPQRILLHHCDIFVTHGGLNSIIDGIITITPMIGVPVIPSWDRLGNLSRLEFYGLGKVLSKNSISFSAMQSAIDELKNNFALKSNLSSFRDKILKEASRCTNNVYNIIHDHEA